MNVSYPFIRRPVGTTLLAIGLFLAGAVAYRFLPVASMPTVEFPTIRVSASRPGADPTVMAATVAAPLERRLGVVRRAQLLPHRHPVAQDLHRHRLGVLVAVRAEPHDVHRKGHPPDGLGPGGGAGRHVDAEGAQLEAPRVMPNAPPSCGTQVGRDVDGDGFGPAVHPVRVEHQPLVRLEPQPDAGVTYAEKIDKSETRIDWSKPAAQVHNHIRGLSPFPGAWFEMAGDKGPVRVKVLRSTPAEGRGAPGTVLDDALTIACGEGAVRILELQRAGKQPMKADEFLRGTPVTAGTRLG